MGLLNLELILSPISPDQPCGLCKETSDSLELLNAFALMQQSGETARKIEKARADLELLPSTMRADVIRDLAGRSNDPKKDPGWASVALQCTEILEKYSKDTRVLGWLVEAMLRAHGYRGLSEALDAVNGLVEAHANRLYPFDPSDPIYAISFLDRLNQSSSLLDGFGRVTVTPHSSVSYSSKLLARHLESLSPDQRSEMQEAGILSFDQIEAEIEKSEASELKEYLEDIEKAIERSEKLDSLLTTLSGKAGFGFNRIRNELQTIRTWFKELTQSKLAENAEPTQTTEEGDAAAIAGTDKNKGSPASKSGVYQSREEALSSLVKVASYFRRTEPHSPLSYSLEQSVRWGKMPLPDLLMELVRNDEVREEMFRRMGIQEKSREEVN